MHGHTLAKNPKSLIWPMPFFAGLDIELFVTYLRGLHLSSPGKDG